MNVEQKKKKTKNRNLSCQKQVLIKFIILKKKKKNTNCQTSCPTWCCPIYVISFGVTNIKASHAFFTGFPAFFLGKRPLTFYVLLCETHTSSCHGERLSTERTLTLYHLVNCVTSVPFSPTTNAHTRTLHHILIFQGLFSK